MPGNPGGLRWHPTGKMHTESRAWGTRFFIIIIDLAALESLLHRAKWHNKFFFSKWWFTTNCLFSPYQTILWAVFTIIKLPVEVDVRSFLYAKAYLHTLTQGSHYIHLNFGILSYAIKLSTSHPKHFGFMIRKWRCLHHSLLKSLLTNIDFQTWPLIHEQHIQQPMRSHSS